MSPLSIDEKIATVESFKRGNYNRDFAHLGKSARRARLRRLELVPLEHQHHIDWTLNEIAELVRLRESGMTTPKIAKQLKRTKHSVDGKIGQLLREKRIVRIRAPKRNWTTAARRTIDANVDNLIGHLARTLERTSDSIRHEVFRSVRDYGRRAKFRNIQDLGGMVQVTPPGPKRKREAA